MSTAFYPLGMKSYNNHTNQGGYKSWKGEGAYSNPIGITSGNIRPLTNNDQRNTAIYRQGATRPIKQYRRGTSTPIYLQSNGQSNGQVNPELDYYSNRQVKSSVSDKIIGQMIDRPGEFSIKQNQPNQENTINSVCNSGCNGVAIVSNWAPITNLTEKPQPTTENPYLCCNAQRKAKRRAIYASTNLKKNYYTTTMSKLYNRCKTFEQKQFNYYIGPSNETRYDEQVVNNPAITQQDINDSKPGGPLTYLNTYRGNCNPNIVITAAQIWYTINQISFLLVTNGYITYDEWNSKSANIKTINDFINFLKNDIAPSEVQAALEVTYKILNSEDSANKNGLFDGPLNLDGCNNVVYKPSNSKYAHQGAVTGSTRMLRINVDAINKNLANIKAMRGRNSQIYKNKAPACKPAYFTKDGNAKTCSLIV